MSLYRYFASKKPLEVVINESSDIEAQFEVLPCRTTPPIAAGGQIQKPYVYKVRGVGTQLHQLVAYIHHNVDEHNRVEFWSIWHSEKVPSSNLYRFHPQHLTIEDLQFLHNNENSCIRFFPRNK